MSEQQPNENQNPDAVQTEGQEPAVADMTVAQLKDALTAKGIAFKGNASKAELVALLSGEPEQEEKPDAVQTVDLEFVTLARPYAYLEDDGETAHHWQAGQVVKDPKEIANLIERQAPLVEVQYPE